MYPLYDLPPTFEPYLEQRLNVFGFSLKEPQKLAEAIRKLSNHFLKGDQFGDYWTQKEFRAAYISYFSILNFLRVRSVFHEARDRKFLKDAKVIVDWGCGAGAALLALLAEWQQPSQPKLLAVDQSADAIDECKHWMKLFEVDCATKRAPLSDLKKMEGDTLVVSYVLNEVDDWPEIPSHVKRIVVIEPSTHQAGRRMLRWRDERLKNGWYAWAPCTHQNSCPLLINSGKDWCHHRIHWNKPGWFYDLEKFLPMKNDTLTLSYLLLSREKPVDDLLGIARVVGDEQEEKGKSRQMICRGPAREFLSWLHRDQISLRLKRGDLVKIKDAEPRGSELRVHLSDAVEKIQPKEK